MYDAFPMQRIYFLHHGFKLIISNIKSLKMLNNSPPDDTHCQMRIKIFHPYDGPWCLQPMEHAGVKDKQLLWIIAVGLSWWACGFTLCPTRPVHNYDFMTKYKDRVRTELRQGLETIDHDGCTRGSKSHMQKP